EHRLPANVVARDAQLRDPLERERLARVFGRGLGDPVGNGLPLRRAGGGWHAANWFFRGATMFLVPGASPVGFRLPLESLPWADPALLDFMTEPDPFEELPRLPSRRALSRAAQDPAGQPFPMVEQRLPQPGESALDVVRTALAVEERDGAVHVFLPPLENAEDWLALVAAVEDTADGLGRPVVLEGYAPPADSRLA